MGAAGTHIGGTGLHRRGRDSMPHAIIVALVVAVAINVGFIAWLCATADTRCPATYLEDQIRLWTHESSRNPDSPLAWVTLGGLYESLGESSKAAAAYDTALALDSTNAAALMNRAERHKAAGEFEAARNDIIRAIDAQPTWSAYRSWYRLGLLEESAGRPEEAMIAYRTAVRLCQTCWGSHYRMALLYEQSGEIERALAAIAEAYRWAPGDEGVLAAYQRLAGE